MGIATSSFEVNGRATENSSKLAEFQDSPPPF